VKILFRNTAQIGSTPAVVDRQTGDIEINVDRWPELTPLEREMVLLHEIGHYLHNTADEKTADAYAMEKLAEKYGPDDAEKFFSTFHNTLRGTASYEERMGEVAFRAADLVDQDTNNEIPKKMIKKKRIARSWEKGSVFQPQKSAASGSGQSGSYWANQQAAKANANNPVKPPTYTRYILNPLEQIQSGLSPEEYALAKMREAELAQHGRVGVASRLSSNDYGIQSTSFAGLLSGNKIAQILSAFLIIGALVYFLLSKKTSK